MLLSWIRERHMTKVDRKVLWDVLRIYGVGSNLL